MNKQITLFQLLGFASEAISINFPEAVWFHCEISDVKVKSGYAFLELQECDPNGKKVAACQASIWSQQMYLFSKFQKITGTSLQKGMKVLMLGELRFDPQWGMKISIKDIDPSWTLGETEKNNKLIKEQLIAEKLWDLNKIKKTPKDFYNVAVLCPANSAGEGDFFVEAQKLENMNLCKFTTYHSVFEGQSTQAQIVAALKKIQQDQLLLDTPFDALCIIRGGGSATGFTWLNNYEILKHVCQSELPVFSGIGHEKDSTLIDEVANLNFGTPSKVIGYITQTIVQQALDAENNWQTIKNQSLKTLSQAENFIEQAKIDLKNLSNNIISQAEAVVSALAQEINGLGPNSVLKKGYAIVRMADKVVLNGSSISEKNEDIEIQFSDRKLKAKLLKNKNL